MTDDISAYDPLAAPWPYEYVKGWIAHHNRVIRALAFYEYADYLDTTTKLHAYAMDDNDWDEHKRVTASIRAWGKRQLEDES